MSSNANKTSATIWIPVVVAVIALIGTVSTTIISNWKALFPPEATTGPTIALREPPNIAVPAPVIASPAQSAAANVPDKRPLIGEPQFAGFACMVNSYGGDLAEALRKRVASDLYNVYGCSIAETAMIDTSACGAFAGFHTWTRAGGAPSWFASQNSVFYYDDSARSRAALLADDLARRYKTEFSTIEGQLCVSKDWLSRAIVVQIRDDR